MYKYIKIMLIIALALGTSFVSTICVSAETQTGHFYVKADLPDNQIDKHISYFDLRMKPGQKQTLSVVIKNDSDHTVKVSIGAFTASTNANGIIDYSGKSKNDEVLVNDFSDLITIRDNRIKIPSGGSKRALFDLKMPKEEFDGAILGGFTFTEINKENETSSDTAFSINNVVSYALAVKLTENDKKIPYNLTLTDVEYKSVDYKPSFVNSIRNKNPLVMSGADMTIKITNTDKDEVVAMHTNGRVGIAPNSLMPYKITVEDDDRIVPGNYLSNISISHDNENILLEKEFVVTKDDLSKAEDSGIPYQMPLWLKIIILLLILLTITSAILFIRMRKYKKRADQRGR